MQQNTHLSEGSSRLDPATQSRVIALAARLQKQREEVNGNLTVDQLAETAREAGLDPDFVREAASREFTAHRARKRLWMSSPALLSLLSLLAFPTHNGVWWVSMSALAFTSFLSPASAEEPHRTDPPPARTSDVR